MSKSESKTHQMNLLIIYLIDSVKKCFNIVTLYQHLLLKFTSILETGCITLDIAG